MIKYQVTPTSRFKKDLKKYINRKKDKQAIFEAIDLLAIEGNKSIPKKMYPHKLSGNYKGYWECHIKSDLLLIWSQREAPVSKIFLVRIGSHSDLF